MGLPARGAAEQEGGDPAPLFTRQDAALAGALVGIQLVFFAFDEQVRDAAEDARGGAADDVASALRRLGRKPPLYVASAATYLAGTLAREHRVADVGLHALVSLALAHAVTGGLKGLGGRARPVVLERSGTDSAWVARSAHEWKLLEGWRGGGPRQSWPSGHAAAGFAVAATLAEELGRPALWVGYPLAAGVAWSRVHEGAHWASDVIMGAAIGMFAARLVVRYGHRRGGWLERALLVEPDGAGGAVAVGARIPLGIGEALRTRAERPAPARGRSAACRPR
jgi:membrane-associated phospholipid phosphatase